MSHWSVEGFASCSGFMFLGGMAWGCLVSHRIGVVSMLVVRCYCGLLWLSCNIYICLCVWVLVFIMTHLGGYCTRVSGR